MAAMTPSAWHGLCVLLWMAVAAFLGCTARTQIGPAVDLSPSQRALVADIPIPDGFALVDRSSEDWMSGPLRYIRHRYQGRASRASLRLFFRKEMPLCRWTPVDEGCIGGRCTMSYSRPAEKCTVWITPGKEWIGSKAIVEVLVAPTGWSNSSHSDKKNKTRQ